MSAEHELREEWKLLTGRVPARALTGEDKAWQAFRDVGATFAAFRRDYPGEAFYSFLSSRVPNFTRAEIDLALRAAAALP